MAGGSRNPALRDFWGRPAVRFAMTKGLVLLFAALTVACAFDRAEAQGFPFSLSPGETTLCGALNASTLETHSPAGHAPHASSGGPVEPSAVGHPLWVPAHSIDHPPEVPA